MMFHPHSSYIWTEILSKLAIIPLMVLLILMLTSQLVRVQIFSPSQPIKLPYSSRLDVNY